MGPNERETASPASASTGDEEFIRAENEDDDGYDPYSDRRPQEEPLFERDPWAYPVAPQLVCM